MDIQSIVLGYIFSTIISTIILWILIDKLGWNYLAKKLQIPKKEPGILTLPMGVVERVLYTTAFLVYEPTIIGIWLVLKVATHWGRWTKENQRGTYNLFLIGNALSIILSYLGASIAYQEFIRF
ncbi:hypothetical protein A8B79_12685 [Balneola sp. EhC07]|uniref:hypothetical protein n=1 Tax=Balneola sp. EhC07 TaxID=1849360 RepID=UPI0007F4123A|nr:hypothetical protein [Balneola sp. EhC07]OAN64197.1 hypothetical protein A8B79_12685 [Balneola sp. EhC07]